MSYLPSNFVVNMTEFTNYSKNPLRIVPTSGQGSVRSNGFIKFTLPIAVIDFKTFSIFFDAKTLVNGADAPVDKLVGFPKFIGQSLIETLDIFVNGRNVQSIPQYGRIYALLQNYKNNYNSQVKKLQTNADPSQFSAMNNTGAITKYNTYAQTNDANVNGFKGRYVLNDWVGFMDCQPSILDLNVIGNVEIHMKLVSPNVLFASGLVAGDNVDYELSNIVAYVDQIHMKSDAYFSTIKSLLEKEDGLQILFKNYMLYLGDEMTASKATTLKITENTSCLNKVLFGCWDNTQPNGKQPLQLGNPAKILTPPAVVPGVFADVAAVRTYINTDVAPKLVNINDGYIPATKFNASYLLAANRDGGTNLNNSIYYKQNGLGIGTCQLEINSQDQTNPLSLIEQWQQTLQTFELNDDDLKQINPAIRDIHSYEREFYVCAFSTEHINNKDDRLGWVNSGRNTMSSSMNISIKTTQNPDRGWNVNQTAIPFIITEMTSRLQVKGQRQVLPVR